MTDTHAPRFTVIMNVYNGAKLVGASIESVLAQTLPDWEMIIWDDRSTDDTADVCARYTDPRIHLMRAEKNTGLGMARNLAMAHAKGDWVSFLDQDDIWTPDKLAGQDAVIRADTTGRLALLYGRTERFNESGPIGPFDPWYGNSALPEGDISDALLGRPSFICNSAMVFRRDVLEKYIPVPGRVGFCTDYYLCTMIARDWRAGCMQTLCCHYRVHAGSMTYVYRKRLHEEILWIIETAARPHQRAIVRRRRLAHQSLIGIEEIRGGAPLAGILRILRHGSLAYLTLRPAIARLRRFRDRLTPA